jgi:hypothetical protein
MRKLILCLALIYSLVMVTACPSRSKLERAFNESARVAQLAETAARTTGDLYQAGILSLEAKDRIAASLGQVVTNGKQFHQLLVGLKNQYGDRLDNAPASALQHLDLVFSTQVIAPFLEILRNVGALPAATAQNLMVVLAVLKTAIMTVAGVFGSGSASHRFYTEQLEAKAYAAA